MVLSPGRGAGDGGGCTGRKLLNVPWTDAEGRFKVSLGFLKSTPLPRIPCLAKKKAGFQKRLDLTLYSWWKSWHSFSSGKHKRRLSPGRDAMVRQAHSNKKCEKPGSSAKAGSVYGCLRQH